MSNLTSQQIEQLEKLNLLPDEQIDTSDIPEITDWTGAVRGKHYQAYQQGTNIVLLDPDVAAHFKDAQAVNHALRLLIQLAGQEVKHPVEMTDKAA